MLLPEPGECTELFFHSAKSDAVQCSGGILRLNCGTSLCFDAYYNLFPAKVYRDYTVCTVPTLYLQVKGKGTVSLLACDAQGNILAEEYAETDGDAIREIALRLQIPHDAAAVYWRFSADSDCVLYRGYLKFAESVQQKVTLAVGVCTYKREKFVKRNASKIAAFLEKKGMDSHLFISDNGGTLSGLVPDSPYITCVQNPNTGGSGGFSRVMQEVLRSKTKFTHLLLMDDDIDFRPEILARLIVFLSHCRTQYAHITVGGAMCLLDAPWMQFEAGAKFLKGGRLQGLMQNLDLRNAENCIRNAAAPQEADYNSWWCCCMSVSKIVETGLSMPFFFKMDDVEYALRLGEKTVCLPGVCVAHESFEKKYNPALEYYIVRNTLITCAVHRRAFGVMGRIKQLFAAVMRNVQLQRYDTAVLILRAYCDFLKGPVALQTDDPEILYGNVLQSVPKFQPVENELHISEYKHIAAALLLLTMGGIFLPSKSGAIVVDALHARASQGFRASEIVHYHPDTNTQYVTRLNRRRAFCIIGKSVGIALKLLLGYHRVEQSFQKNASQLYSNGFWEKCNGDFENGLKKED